MKVLLEDGRSGSRPLTPREMQVIAWALQHFSTTAYRAGFDGNDALEARRLGVEFDRAFKSSTAEQIAATEPVKPWSLPTPLHQLAPQPTPITSLFDRRAMPGGSNKRRFTEGGRVRHIDNREGVVRSVGIARDQVTPVAEIAWENGGTETVALGHLEPMPEAFAATPASAAPPCDRVSGK